MDEIIQYRVSYTPIYFKGSGKLGCWQCDHCQAKVKVFDRNRHECSNRPLGVVTEVQDAEKQNGSDEQTGV